MSIWLGHFQVFNLTKVDLINTYQLKVIIIDYKMKYMLYLLPVYKLHYRFKIIRFISI